MDGTCAGQSLWFDARLAQPVWLGETSADLDHCGGVHPAAHRADVPLERDGGFVCTPRDAVAAWFRLAAGHLHVSACRSLAHSDQSAHALVFWTRGRVFHRAEVFHPIV